MILTHWVQIYGFLYNNFELLSFVQIFMLSCLQVGAHVKVLDTIWITFTYFCTFDEHVKIQLVKWYVFEQKV